MTDEEREQFNRSDLEKINAIADYLNAEMEEVLKYQTIPIEDGEPDDKSLGTSMRAPISDADIEK